MAKKDELFVLIKSLSKSEKRFLKLYGANGNAVANYIKLFDAIDQQDVYDEPSIKHRYRKEKFTKQLHVTKHYLRLKILESLRAFHHNISHNAEVKDILRNVELLFNKELYELCATELDRAERIVQQYELTLQYVEVLSWKRRLKQAIEPHNYAAFLELVHAQSEHVEILSSNNAYWQQMILQTWQTLRVDTAPNTTVDKKLTKPQSLEAWVLHHNTQYIKSMRTGKGQEGEQQLKQLLLLLEKQPIRLREDPASYISSINNLASYLVFSKRDGEAIELINKAKSVYENLKITTEKKSLLKQILRTYNIELEIYRDKGLKKSPDFTFVNNTQKFVQDNRNKIPKEYLLSFWFQLADIHFRHKRYNDSLTVLNNILNTKFDLIRTDLQKYARMLNIIVHLEQKNYFVLRYFIESTKRWVKKYRGVEPYDQYMFKLFLKLASLPEYEHKSVIKEAYEELFQKDDESLIPNEVLDYVDYKYWLEHKMAKG